MAVLFNLLFGFVYPCHRLLHPHSSYCECMADGAIFMVHRAFMVKPRYLLYIIRIMLFSMQQIGYDLQIWFITDSVSQIFFRFISTCAILKDERRRGFLLADSFTTVQWREFYCLHKCSCCCLKNCEDVF